MTPDPHSPYWAWRGATGTWYVVNSIGEYEVECDCRRDAEECATNLNEMDGLTPDQLAEKHASILTGPSIRETIHEDDIRRDLA